MLTLPPEGAYEGGARAGAEAWPVERGELERGAVWRWRVKATAMAVVMVALAVLVAVPLFWGGPEPKPIPLTSLAGQVSGTYTSGTSGLVKLVPYADKLPALPHNLPAVAAGSAILVRARQLDVPEAYELLTFSGDRPVAVERGSYDAHTISLTPRSPLAPAAYYVKAAKDSATAADEYFYFQVR